MNCGLDVVDNDATPLVDGPAVWRQVNKACCLFERQGDKTRETLNTSNERTPEFCLWQHPASQPASLQTTGQAETSNRGRQCGRIQMAITWSAQNWRYPYAVDHMREFMLIKSTPHHHHHHAKPSIHHCWVSCPVFCPLYSQRKCCNRIEHLKNALAWDQSWAI